MVLKVKAYLVTGCELVQSVNREYPYFWSIFKSSPPSYNICDFNKNDNILGFDTRC